MEDDSVTSLAIGITGAKQTWDVVFAEDVAWADSCLIKDPEKSETNLDSLADALLDVLSCYSEPDSSAAETDALHGTSDTEMLSSIRKRTSQNFKIAVHDEEEIHGLPGTTDTESEMLFSTREIGTSQDFKIDFDDVVPTNEEAKTNSDDNSNKDRENIDMPFSRSILEGAFLPTFKDEMREIHYPDSDEDLTFPKFMSEQPPAEDIFKVWDLEIPVEEDELVQQLNKAISEESSKTTVGEYGVDKGLEEVSLDDLVAGIADLSLKQNSS